MSEKQEFDDAKVRRAFGREVRAKAVRNSNAAVATRRRAFGPDWV